MKNKWDGFDGQTLNVPLAWYPRLVHATQDERNNWELIGEGQGIRWPDLDEDLVWLASGKIQPDRWLAEYTTELLNVLHVLGCLVALHPRQADLLTRICTGPLISADTLRDAGAFDVRRKGRGGQARAR